ncbi:MAG: hypothetical protein OQK80_03280 [Sedimenticola sp.]|nr:hypothetical protein [Sedimenticola sp.]
MINKSPLLAALIIISISMSMASFGAAAAEQKNTTDPWTPNSLSDLKRTIVIQANDSRDPIIALFLRPDHFNEDIGIASALFLDTSSTHARKGMYVALLAPVEVEVIIVDAYRVYFRDQALKAGKKYRSQKVTYTIDCVHNEIGIGNINYYSRPVGGVKLNSSRAINVDDIQREYSKPGSIPDYVLKAVCNGKVMYEPK